MTEAELTTKHTGELRRRHPTWVVLKHCDRFTATIPDVSVSLGELTVWVEYKILRRRDQSLLLPETWVDNNAQLEQLRRLCGYYLVYDPIVSKNHVLVSAEYTYLDQALAESPGDGLTELEKLLIHELQPKWVLL